MDINKVTVAGRLGQDPEVKVLPSGIMVANLNIASNRRWKDKNSGEQKEATEWHRVIFFGNTAEVIGKYFRKGKEIYVEGRLQTRSWEKDGEKRYATEIVGSSFQFVGSDGSQSPTQSSSSQEAQPAPKDDVPTVEYPEEEINPEDIPF